MTHIRSMRHVISRFLSTMLMVLALIAPLAGNMALALGIGDGRVLVICSGDGLRTIILNEAGEPVEVSDKSESCVLSHAVSTAGDITLSSPITGVVYALTDPFGAQAATPAPDFKVGHPRAPPIL